MEVQVEKPTNASLKSISTSHHFCAENVPKQPINDCSSAVDKSKNFFVENSKCRLKRAVNSNSPIQPCIPTCVPNCSHSRG